MKKKFLLLVLAVSMVCAGCGKNKEETTETASTEEIEDLESTEEEVEDLESTEETEDEDLVNKEYTNTYGESVGVVFESDYTYTEQIDTTQQETGVTYAYYTSDYMTVVTGVYAAAEGQTVETVQASELSVYEGVTFSDGGTVPLSDRTGTIAKVFDGTSEDGLYVYVLCLWQDDASNVKECCMIFNSAEEDSLNEYFDILNTVR